MLREINDLHEWGFLATCMAIFPSALTDLVFDEAAYWLAAGWVASALLATWWQAACVGLAGLDAHQLAGWLVCWLAGWLAG